MSLKSADSLRDWFRAPSLFRRAAARYPGMVSHGGEEIETAWRRGGGAATVARRTVLSWGTAAMLYSSHSWES